ncbi:hypothetical protein E5D57_007462 [Metarhizium anisopliae]|nr:hypothetical protein E5D57_007462 [Metarhizium anisopliae]
MPVFSQLRESGLFINMRPPLCPPLRHPRPSSQFTKFPDHRSERDQPPEPPEPPTTNLVGKLKLLVHYKSSASRPKTEPVARICKMPLKIVMGIVANLSTKDQVSFRNTCTIFRKMSTMGYSPLFYRMSTHMVRTHVLSLILRDFWICDLCFRLHRVDRRDTPGTPKRPICVQPHVDASRESEVSDAFPWIFSYRHLHFYLKAARSNEHSEYRDRLLQRRQITRAVKNSRMGCSVEAAFHPLGFDRRVVLHRSWLYRPAKQTEPAPYWDMQICPHQRYSESEFEAFEKEVSQASVKSKGLFFEVLSPQRREYALCKAVQTSIVSPSKHTFGACTLCRTDFSVKIMTLETPKGGSNLGVEGSGVRDLLLRTWQDLGGHCFPLYPTWASHSHILHDVFVPFGYMYRYCEPGTAWRLYEQEYERLGKRTESQCAENNRIGAMYRCMEEKTQTRRPEVFQIEKGKNKFKSLKRKHDFF